MRVLAGWLLLNDLELTHGQMAITYAVPVQLSTTVRTVCARLPPSLARLKSLST